MSQEASELRASSRLIRHCRRRWKDDGLPTVEAFKLRKSELEQDDPYLSFNWLEKLCENANVQVGREEAIRELEKCPPLEIKPGELWIVLSRKRIEDAIQRVSKDAPEIDHMPVDCNDSHVSVKGYDVGLNCDVASELAEEVELEDINRIKVRRKPCCQS